ncbi:DUF3502 domain-containing protein [Paenibacillus pinistramenti]|uniref:DUF3502 domain-containing protein n=1 Tax=Paenibacillus pinistramenti TaxID=1768003 RepID=UPI00110899B5|nr:DUF3502 domain-containing protein [Paenibacillus pinistramenti]
MIRLKKRGFALSALLLSSVLLLSACGGGGSGNSSNSSNSGKSGNTASSSSNSSAGSSNASQETKVDHSKEVKIVGYLLGDQPKGMPEVLDQLNDKLKKDINATLELNYIGWGDVASKYPLVLASGEDVDFVFAADWNFYVAEATKNAFLPLDENMFKTYMPKYYAKQNAAAYKAAEVNGKQYMIPTTTPDRKVNLFVLRKDVMDKAGLKEVTKFSELEPYFAEIKKDYPDMIPLNLDSQYDLPTPFDYLVNEKFAYSSAPMDSGDPMSVGVYTDWEDPAGKVLSITEEPVQSAFKYAAGIMKDWYDKGYVNKNPYSNKTRSKDNFADGKSGVAFGNSIDIQATLAAATAKGIDTYVFPQLSPSGHAIANSWLNNGVAIAAGSKNPERTMEALDLIMEDESYVHLDYYGIEGKNYEFTSDGKLTLPQGVTTDTNTYPPDAAGFWFVDKDYLKPSADWTANYLELYNKTKDYLVPATFSEFAFNSDKVKGQEANLKNVASQYFLPLTVGSVKDVDAAFDTLVSKMNAAGISKVKTELEAQASEYLKSKAK